MNKLNLKYFTTDGKYILHRETYGDTDNKIVQEISVCKIILLPTNSIDDIEKVFDECVIEILDNIKKIQNMDEVIRISILGDYLDLDEVTDIFKNGIMNKEIVDRDNSKYMFEIDIELELKITLSSLFDVDWINSIKNLFTKN